MLRLMNLGNSSLCGHVANWTLGQVYDVTGTRGCDTLGVSIPESSHVLIKVERHPHSDFILLSELKNKVDDFYTKITQFSSKLKRCRTVPKRWVHYNLSGDANTVTSSAKNPQSTASVTHTSLHLIIFGVIASLFKNYL